ncbi:hypothetical protein ACI65C_004816 [Semiaphis heraclei]
MDKRKSWLWDYAKREKDHAYLCDDDQNKFSCVGGTTGSLIRHLQNDASNLLINTYCRSQLGSNHPSNDTQEVIRSRSSEHENNTTSINQDDNTNLVNNTTTSSSTLENNKESKSRKRRRISKIWV